MIHGVTHEQTGVVKIIVFANEREYSKYKN